MAFIRGFLDRIILVVGIVGGGCIPSFVTQYRQRLGGRLDQVLKDLEPFQRVADQYHHGSLKALIEHHLNSSDATFHEEGAAVQAMLNSAEQLRRALQALETDLFHQLAYLLTGGVDTQIAHSTWLAYSPSFDLTVESIVLASVVGVLIWLVFLFIWHMLAKLVRLLSAR